MLCSFRYLHSVATPSKVWFGESNLVSYDVCLCQADEIFSQCLLLLLFSATLESIPPIVFGEMTVRCLGIRLFTLVIQRVFFRIDDATRSGPPWPFRAHCSPFLGHSSSVPRAGFPHHPPILYRLIIHDRLAANTPLVGMLEISTERRLIVQIQTLALDIPTGSYFIFNGGLVVPLILVARNVLQWKICSGTPLPHHHHESY